MKEIQLTKGKVTLVDDEDFEYLNQWKWQVNKDGYAARSLRRGNVRMHRVIMNTPKGFETDHINGNKLDNRRCNLRVCTHSENMRNRPIQNNNKSGFRGVHQKKRTGLWYAQIKINAIQKYLGCFKTPQEASEVYEKEAEKQYGQFRRK